LRTLYMSDRRAWRIGLYDPASGNQFEVVLGRRDLAGRMRRFQRFYSRLSLVQKQTLQRIDARYPNGVAIATASRPGTDVPASNKGDQT